MRRQDGLHELGDAADRLFVIPPPLGCHIHGALPLSANGHIRALFYSKLLFFFYAPALRCGLEVSRLERTLIRTRHLTILYWERQTYGPRAHKTAGWLERLKARRRSTLRSLPIAPHPIGLSPALQKDGCGRRFSHANAVFRSRLRY